jgi:hybrid cluster-associated redox disulfide protein
MLVFDVLSESPAAARVFIERRMGCVGCTFARFETVAEVAGVYGCDADELAYSLAAAGRDERNPINEESNQ